MIHTFYKEPTNLPGAVLYTIKARPRHYRKVTTSLSTMFVRLLVLKLWDFSIPYTKYFTDLFNFMCMSILSAYIYVPDA